MLRLSLSVRPALAALVAVASLVPAIAAARPAAPVSEIVIDAAAGRVMYAAAADRARPPASLTKMMTLLLTFEALDAGKLRLGDQLTMTRSGARLPPSKLGLPAGQTISVRAAINAVAVVSANDVAAMLAERIAGSQTAFVRAMNRRAAQLGMAGTRFANPTGLAPAGGITTARDMATLARYLVRRHPDRYGIFGKRSIRWGRQVRPNHNKLLGKVRGVDGIKTGYTVPAGYNLAASAKRGGKRMIVVVLGARTAAARDLLVANLLESGFSNPGRRPARRPPPSGLRRRGARH